MWYVILIIIIIVLYRNNADTKNELNKIKKEANDRINYCPNCGCDLYHNHSIIDNEEVDNYEDVKDYDYNIEVQDYNNIEPKKPVYTDKEVKNSLILIVGSILIILSAILFLTTTWNVTHNVFKTLVIVLMLIVFFSASYIADKFLNLKATSKAFYYIGLAYLPIVFLSISLFSLFGKYFSIYGLGKYVYLFFSSIITTYIYYYNAKKRDSKLLSIVTIIFSCISVILFGLIFTDNLNIIILVLFIYLIIICYLYLKEIFIFDKELYLKTITTLLFSLSIVTVYYNLYDVSNGSVMIQDILLDMVMFYSIYLYTNKIVFKNSIYQYIYPVFIVLMFCHFSCLFSMFIIKQLLIILSFILLYVYDLIKKNYIQIYTFFTILFFSFILYLVTIIYIFSSISCIPSYVILLVLAILSLIHYFYKDMDYEYPEYCFNTIIMVMVLDFIITNGLSIIYLGYSSLIMLCMSFVFNNSFKKSLLVIGNISFILISLVNYNNSIYLIMLYGLYSIITFILFYRERKDLFKILSYIYINYSLILLMVLMNNDNGSFYVIPITTMVLMGIEYLVNSLDNDNNHRYIYFQLIISLIILNVIEASIFNFLFLIIIDVLYIFYIKKNKWNNNNLYISFLALIPYIYTNGLFEFYSFDFMYCLSIGMLLLFSYLIYSRKNNMYIWLYFIFTLFHLLSFDDGKYISLLIISIGVLAAYLIKDDKSKDMLRGVLYTIVLIFFRFIIFDFDLEEYAILHYGIYLVWLPFITRTVIKNNDNNDYMAWEFIGCTFINLLSICNYSSEMDGIIYVFLLTIFVIISYTLKLGPIFIVCLLSILINVLLLTRTFWLSIPWWLYILLIGSILVGFAIYNEMNIKKDKEGIIDKIKRLLNL